MAVGSIFPVFSQELPRAYAASEMTEELFGWGINLYGTLGDGAYVDRPLPVPIPPPTAEMQELGITRWSQVEITSMWNHNFAITPTGEMFAWGRNTMGELGDGSFTNRSTPVRISPTPAMQTAGITNWNEAELFFFPRHAFALAPNGTLFAWGHNNTGQLGDGSFTNRATPVSVPLTQAMINAGITNWNHAEIIGRGYFAYALAPNGALFGWGNNTYGRLGDGTTVNRNTPVPISVTPAMITAGITNWNHARFYFGGWQTFVIAPNNQMFGWGVNVAGQLGIGNFDVVTTPVPIPSPTAAMQAAGITNWSQGTFLPKWQSNFIIAPNGQMFGWGRNLSGELADGTFDNRHTPIPVVPTPAMVTAGITNWNQGTLFLNAHTSFIIAPNGQMFSWGMNYRAQIGDGTTEHRSTPVLIPLTQEMMDAGATNWFGARLHLGFHHTFAFIRINDIPLTKTLRLNEGTIVPGTEMPINTPAGMVSDEATFTFNFVQRPSIRISDDPIRYSHAQVPAITNQTITIDPDTATAPVNGVFTVTGNSINIWALIEDALGINPGAGVFVWELYEVAGSSGLHDYPDVQMAYDTSRFQIRAHVGTIGLIHFVEIFEMERVGNVWQIVLPKLEEGPNFTNTYTRLVGDEGLPLHNALLISKEVADGDMADPLTQFNFTLTLTNPALTPPVVGDGTTGPVIAQVVESGTTTPVSPPRTVNIAPGANTFFLRDGESLLIPQLPAGTSFTVTEAQVLDFRPEASVTAIPIPPATGVYPKQNTNTELVTGTYIIHQVNNNIAAFTNTHQWDVPTGLFITSTPWVALCAAGLLLGLLATSRNRRRIEELPLVL